MTRVQDAVRRSPAALFAVLVVGTALVALSLAAAAYTSAPDPGVRCHRSGIVALELAGDTASARHIVDDWTCPNEQSTDAARDRAEQAILRDSFVFIPSYVAAITFWCFYASWYAHRPKSRQLARALTYAAVLAGVLDVVENVALWEVVHGHPDKAVVATAAALPKWGLVILAAVVALQAMSGAWMRWLRHVTLGETDRPQFSGPVTSGEQSILSPLTAPTPEASRRERRRQDPHGQEWEAGIGVCFSGGGIRSASFALGALHALEESHLDGDTASVWERSRYLSTVSGGGYTGTAAQILAHQSQPDDPPPLAPGSEEYTRLRNSRRYLWSEPTPGNQLRSTQEFVSGVLLFFGGIALNIALLEAVGYLVATPVGWAARYGFYPGRTTEGGTDRAWTSGQRLGWMLLAALVLLFLFRHLHRGSGSPTLGSVGAVVVKVVSAIAFLAVATRADFGHGWLFLLPLAPLAVALAFSVSVSKLAHGWSTPRWVISAALNVTLYSFAGILLWYWANNGFQRGFDEPVSPLLFTIVAALVIGIAVFVTVAAVLRILLQSTARSHPSAVYLSAIGAFVTAVAVGATGAWSLTDLTDSFAVPSGAFYLAAAVIVGTIYLTVDQKRWSPHPVYKARLARTFAMTRDACGHVSELPYRYTTDLTRWGTRPPRGPELLIGAAVYDTVELRRGEVKAWPFVFSGEYVGGADVGWTRATDFEAGLGRLNLSDGTLEAAMSISGAAVSPAIGQINLGSANAVIAVANARLGVWLPGPRYIAELKKDDFAAPTWLRIRRFSHLLHEIAGTYDLDSRFVYVTDGGQVDNLGLTELLARGCDPIICFDASGDLKPNKDLNTNTFDEVRELVRRRLGVRFSAVGASTPDGPEPQDSDGRDPLVTKHALTVDLCTRAPLDKALWPTTPAVPVAVDCVAEMDVWYPGREKRGRLVVAKCVLTPNAPECARDYALGEGRHRFPSDTTVDQWLGEQQFDAYVALGRYVGTRAIERLNAPPPVG